MLLKMAGHSGSVPSAVLAADIPALLARLKQALASAESEKVGQPSVPSETEDRDADAPVSLRLRAYPLIQLLSAAAEQGCDVMWEKGAPLV